MNNRVNKLKPYRLIALILALAVVLSAMPLPAFAEEIEIYNASAEIVDPNDESFADGWKRDGTGSPSKIVRTDEASRTGNYSIKIEDNDGSSYHAYAPSVPVTINTEYIGRFYIKTKPGTLSSANAISIYFQFQNSAGARVGSNKASAIQVESPYEFRPLSVISSTTDTKVTQAAIFAGTASSPTVTAYVDDFSIKPLTLDLLLEFIEEKLVYSGTTDEILEALNTKAGSFENVKSEYKNGYHDRLLQARTQKGSPLTKAEIQEQVNAENAYQQAIADIAAVKAQLTSMGTSIVLSETGEIALPQPTDLKGATLAWTSVAGDGASLIQVADGMAVLVDRPNFEEGDKTAQLTLTISKDGQSDTLVYNVTIIKKMSESLIEEINEKIDENDAQGLFSKLVEAQVLHGELDESLKDEYLSRLSAAKSAKGGPLDLEEIQSCLRAANDYAADMLSVNEVIAALEEAGLDLVIEDTGPIPLPGLEDLKGTTLRYTDAEGDIAPLVEFHEGEARVITRPLITETDKTGKLTLTVSKGEASGTLDYNLTIKKYKDILLNVVNHSFEDANLETGEAAGWTYSGSQAPFNIWVTDDISFIGKNSLYLLDDHNNVSRSAGHERVKAQPGRIYIAAVRAYAVNGKTDVYFEFYNTAGTRIYYVTAPAGGPNRWEKTEIIARAPEGTDSIRLLLNSTRGNICEIYFDEVLLFEMSEDTCIEKLNTAADSSETETFMMYLQNTALGFNVDTGYSDEYLTAFKNAKTQKGSNLTKEEIEAIVNQVNDARDQENTVIVNQIISNLQQAGLTITVSELGEIAIPDGATENGAEAFWSKVEGDVNNRIFLDMDKAVAESLPLKDQGAETVQMTLTIRKGKAVGELVYTIILSELSEDESILFTLKDALSEEYIAGQNTALWDVRHDLVLPASGAALGFEGAVITWTSSKPEVINIDGTVNRPAYGAPDEIVTLHADLSYNQVSTEKTFLVRVRSVRADAGRVLNVPNNSFEDTSLYSYEKWLNNWVYTHVTADISASRDMAFSGQYSLKMVDPNSSATGGARTTNIYGASEGNLYRASVLYYSEEALPYIYVDFWDTEGILVADSVYTAAQAANRGKWSELSIERIAPPGTAYVTTTIYSPAGTMGTTYFDCVMIEEYPVPVNGNFEAGLVDGVPAGWTLAGGSKDSVSLTGTGELKINGNASIASAKKAAAVGVDMVAQIDARLVSGTASITLECYNASGTLLDSVTQPVAGSDYTTYTLRISPVSGAAAVAVILSAEGEAYFDNLKLAESPVGTAVYNGGFEKVWSGTAIGWSGGNVSSTNVKEGQYSLAVGEQGAVSARIPVYEGKQYILTADILSQADVDVVIKFYGNDGVLVETVEDKAAGSQDWNRYIKSCYAPVVAPARSCYAIVEFSCLEGTAYIDNVDFRTITSSISNRSFEITTLEPRGTFPVNWSAHGDVFAGSTTEKASDTVTSLYIRGSQGEVRSSYVEIIPGKSYTVYADAMTGGEILSGSEGGSITLRFWTRDFSQTGEAVSATITGNVFKTYTVSAVAPEDAAYVTVCLSGSNSATVWFDNIILEESIKEIGTRWQLLIDDYLVKTMTNMTKTLHEGEKQGIVMEFDKEWEGVGVYVYGNAIWDEEEQVFKLWYQTPTGYVCYATSEDGINWIKPSLGIFNYNGSTDNNIIMYGHVPTVFKDSKEPDPQRRYKMVIFNFDYQNNWYDLYYSPDGINWTFHKSLIYGADVVTAAYDEYNDIYVMSVKINAGKRHHRMTTSRDLLDWTIPVKMFSISDPLDAYGYLRADSYGMGLYPRDGVYIGFNWMFQITNGTNDGPIDVRLIFSRDLAEDWIKVSSDPVIPRGEDGEFDDGMIFTASYPLVVGDEVWLYYGGWDDDHRVDYREAKIGLVKWRFDGFVSRDAADTEGVLETKPFIFEGNELILNANASDQGGEIRVELLDENGNIISGFSREDCDVITTDSLEHVVTWNGSSDLSALAGRVIQMKIYAANSEIYAFRFRENIEDYVLDIGDESAGGAGYVRTITISGAKADDLEGKYLVVQFTEGTGVNAKVKVIMMSALGNEATVSYQVAGTKVEAWLTSGMPDLAGEDMGVDIYAHARS